MRQAWRGLAGLLAVGVVAAGGSVALADDGGGHGGRDNNGNRGNNALATTIFTMPAAPDGNPEGVAVDRRSGRFFVSRTGTGAIFVGTLGSPALTPFIAGVRPNPAPTDPPVATGLKVRKGLLYVAGASTGQIRIYNLANPTAAPVVFETGGGFINDLDLDSDGNVFATDSTKSTIYKVTAAQVAAGTGTPEAIDVSSGITSAPGKFNLNGIVARGDELIVVNSNSGELFRITFAGDDNDNDRGDHHARAAQAAGTPTITKIDLGAATVTNGDGLLLDRGRLLVVRGTNGAAAPAAGQPANGSNGLIDVVKLSRHRTRGRVGTPVFDASFSGPSTIARAGKRLLVVNASFTAGPTADGNFTVTGLARNAVRHGGHGGGGHGGS
jgi:Cu-Zn family superoxide dismutase